MDTVNATLKCYSCASFALAARSRRVKSGWWAIEPRLLLTTAILISLLAIPSWAQQDHPSESQVKAVYLYNFGKFVHWPADRAPHPDSLAICVFGKDPLGPVLDSTVAGESIDGKKITVSRPSRIQDTGECNILFISSSEEDHLAPILSMARRAGVLTVSDMPRFAEHGGVIEFVMQEGKIRFQVNRAAAEQSGLALSSQLLKVASKVIDKAPPRGHP